jgi:hypothetical protein
LSFILKNLLSRRTKEQKREYISIFLPRIWRTIEFYKAKHTEPRFYNWNDLFAHTISHEYIHKAIQDAEGDKATAQFDNIAGRINKCPNQVGIGMNINKEMK